MFTELLVNQGQMFVIYDFPFKWQTQNLFFFKKPQIMLFL